MSQPASPDARVGKRVRYSGRVQGVGFRYTAQAAAAEYAVAGWVRNRADGGVELVAEGPPDQVEAFLRDLAGRMAGYIEGVRVQDEVPAGLQGFHVRR
jgi:acylphosphatase